MRILVTGGTGFIGGHLLEDLADRHEVYAIARRPPATGRVRWIEQDLRTLDPDGLPERVDAVVHLAQSARYKEFPDGAADVYAINVESTFALLEWARAAEAQTFVLVSTGGLYAYSPQPVAEDAAIHADGFYFRSKLAAEIVLGGYRELLRTVVLRPFFVYGEGQRRMLIARLAERIAAGREIVIDGDPGLRCNPVHVEDIVRVFEPALTTPVAGVVNVAGPDVVSMAELVAALGEAIGVEPVVRHRSATAGGDLVADTGRMRGELGIEPRVGVRDGLRRVALELSRRSPAR